MGTGFGGAVTACRMSRKWPGGVLILERGGRYPKGSFLRSPRDAIQSFWDVSDEHRIPLERVHALKERGEDLLGVFDLRTSRGMDVLVGAGFGGGSLIYSNVFMVPPDDIFDERWPSSCGKTALLPYYEVSGDSSPCRVF